MINIKTLKQSAILLLLGFVCVFAVSTNHADQNLISLFPLDHYDQKVSTWIKSDDPNYNKSLLSTNMQQKRFDIFFNHYFGPLSPWDENYIKQILQQLPPNDLKTIEQSIINNFNNEGKSDNQIGYGENFRPYTKDWIENIKNNINIAQFENLMYHIDHRGIAIDNLHARALPTDDVYLYNFKLAGEGYPFDNLQISALWAGTPVYILGETRDHAWLLVVTPDYIGWVKSSGIARTDTTFIVQWMKAAKNKLVAITHNQTGLVDANGNFLLLAYIGSIFPGNSNSTIMVPIADTNRIAVIKNAFISEKNSVTMPLEVTPHHFSNVMKEMIDRPYGWGSMYFYNDCSAELKSLLTPFGIWLPRHSSEQITVGHLVDMTSASPEKRLSYLMENGQPFLTIIYIGGHVVMYVGNYLNPRDDSLMAMTYQNIWGLSPKPAIRRAVIGKSVLFPMLLQYPEDSSLTSLADKKFFQVSFLNYLPDASFLLKEKTINLKSLMNVEY